MKFEVSKSFFDKLEDSVFGVVVVKKFDNEISYDYINELFEENLQSSKAKFLNVKIKEEDHIEKLLES